MNNNLILCWIHIDIKGVEYIHVLEVWCPNSPFVANYFHEKRIHVINMIIIGY